MRLQWRSWSDGKGGESRAFCAGAFFWFSRAINKTGHLYCISSRVAFPLIHELSTLTPAYVASRKVNTLFNQRNFVYGNIYCFCGLNVREFKSIDIITSTSMVVCKRINKDTFYLMLDWTRCVASPYINHTHYRELSYATHIYKII